MRICEICALPASREVHGVVDEHGSRQQDEPTGAQVIPTATKTRDDSHASMTVVTRRQSAYFEF